MDSRSQFVRIIAAAALLAPIVFASGCESSPYRLEWGTKKQHQERDQVREGVAPPPPPGPQIAPWTAWETAHESLESRVSRRRQGEPFPLKKLAGCRRAIDRLRAEAPQAQSQFDEAVELYDRLKRRGGNATTRWNMAVLAEVKKVLRDVRSGS